MRRRDVVVAYVGDVEDCLEENWIVMKKWQVSLVRGSVTRASFCTVGATTRLRMNCTSPSRRPNRRELVGLIGNIVHAYDLG